MNAHNIILSLISVIVFYREIPTLKRFLFWLISLFVKTQTNPNGGNVIIKPGLGAPGYSNGKIILQNAKGENIIVIGDSGIELGVQSPRLNS